MPLSIDLLLVLIVITVVQFWRHKAHRHNIHRTQSSPDTKLTKHKAHQMQSSPNTKLTRRNAHQTQNSPVTKLRCNAHQT